MNKTITSKDVFDAAIGEGANQSFLISYNIKDYDAQYNNAMGAAVAQGNTKADAIAKSLGSSTYKLNKITENTNTSSICGIVSIFSII